MANEAERLRAVVESLQRPDLVELLLDAASDAPALRRRLLAREARTGRVDVVGLRKALRSALVPRGFRDYRAAGEWAREAYAALDVLDELLAAGAADAARRLAEDAVVMVEKAAQRVDDPAGHVMVLAERIGEVHLRACEAAPPPVPKLVSWLISRALDGELDVPDPPVAPYRWVLGAEGVAQLREVVVPRFEALPRLGPTDGQEWRGERFPLTRLREELAEDVDELVAVLSHDLSSPYSYVRIASALRDAGRGEEALEWVHRGQRESGRPDSRLRDLEVTLHVDAGQLETAVMMRRDDLDRTPTAHSYAALRELAEQDGTWESERERAREVLRRAAAGRAPTPWSRSGEELVRALLDDGDVDAARTCSQEFPVSSTLRLELARSSEASAPRYAVALYEELVQEYADQVKARAYRGAAALAARVVALRTELDGEAAARTWASDLREHNRRRVRFLTELTKARVP